MGNEEEKHTDSMLDQITQAETIVANSLVSEDTLLLLARETIKLNSLIENATEPPPHDSVQLESMSDNQLSMRVTATNFLLVYNFRLNSQLLNAELLIMRAMVQLQSASYIRGCYNIRSAWKIYDTMYTDIQKNEHRDDLTSDLFVHKDVQECAKCGQALFYYGMSMIPHSVQWVLTYLSGMNPDRKLAVKLFNEVFASETRLSPFASIMLSAHCIMMSTGFKSREEKLRKFEPVLNRTLEKYPNGTGFLFIASQFVRKKGDMERSITLCEQAIESAEKSLNFTPKGLVADLAMCNILNRNYDRARMLLESIVFSETVFGGKSFAALSLATTYTMLDKLEDRTALLDKLDTFFNMKNPRWEKYMIAKFDLYKMIRANEQEVTLLLLLSHFERLYIRDRWCEFSHTADVHVRPFLRQLREHYVKIQKTITMYDFRVAFVLAEATLMRRIGGQKQDVIKDKLNKVITVKDKLRHERQWAVFAYFEVRLIIIVLTL